MLVLMRFFRDVDDTLHEGYHSYTRCRLTVEEISKNRYPLCLPKRIRLEPG